MPEPLWDNNKELGEGEKSSSPYPMNNLLKLICLSIFMVPMASIIQMPGTIIWYPQYLMLIALAFLLGSFLIWQINKPLSVLSIYCLLSYIFVTQQHPRSLLCLIVAYGGIGLVCLITKLKQVKPIYTCIIAMALIQFVLVVLQKFNLDPFFHSIANAKLCDTVGFVGSHNQLGEFYAAIVPFLGWFIPVSFISIFFSQCSTALIAAFVATLLTIAVYNYKISLVFLGMGLVIIPLWGKYDTSVKYAFNERLNICKLSIKQVVSGKAVMEISEKVKHIVACNPLTGFGLGSFLMISPSTQGPVLDRSNPNIYKNTHRFEHAHNDFVEWFFEGGWIGIAIVLVIAVHILYTFLFSEMTNGIKLTFISLISQLILSSGTYVIHAPVSYFMLCLTLGLFYWEVNHARISVQKA